MDIGSVLLAAPAVEEDEEEAAGFEVVVVRAEERRAIGSSPSVSAGGKVERSPSRSRFRRSAEREAKIPSRKREACSEYCNPACTA
jgi:hypothetical protein